MQSLENKNKTKAPLVSIKENQRLQNQRIFLKCIQNVTYILHKNHNWLQLNVNLAKIRIRFRLRSSFTKRIRKLTP